MFQRGCGPMSKNPALTDSAAAMFEKGKGQFWKGQPSLSAMFVVSGGPVLEEQFCLTALA